MFTYPGTVLWAKFNVQDRVYTPASPFNTAFGMGKRAKFPQEILPCALGPDRMHGAIGGWPRHKRQFHRLG